MRTVFPSLVAVCGKGFTTLGAIKCVDGFSAHLVLMRVPPSLPTSGGTELHAFFAGYLFDRLSTTLAPITLFFNVSLSSQSTTLAIRLNGTD